MHCAIPIVLLLFSASALALDCGENGRVLQCPCTKTCDNPEGPHFCPCVEGCSCYRGFLLDETIQKCVLPEECSAKLDKTKKVIYPANNVITCQENAHIERCPCKRTCQDPIGPNSCECKPGCTCDEGYVLDEVVGKCVKTYECKKINVKVEIKCGKNAHLEQCPCNRTCDQPNEPLVCPCKEGCTCDAGYLLDENINACVEQSECSKKPGFFDSIFNIFDDIDNTFFGSDFFGNKKNKTEVVTTTTTTTTTTAQPTTQKIETKPEVKSDLQSNSSSENDTAWLVVINERPLFSDCEENAHYQPCLCERTCKKPERTLNCPCNKRCKCNAGYYRHDTNGKCVKFEDCPQFTGVVYKRSFVGWFSPDEPMHIVFSVLFCCIIVGLLISLCTIKKRRVAQYHGKVIA